MLRARSPTVPLRPVPEQEQRLAPQCARGSRDTANTIDVRRRDAAHREARRHRLARKPGDVLDSAIAFFFDGRDQLAVADERRRHVAVDTR